MTTLEEQIAVIADVFCTIDRAEVAETLEALRADRRDRRRQAHVAALLAYNALPHDPERATMRLGEHLEHHREVLALDRTILDLEATK